MIEDRLLYSHRSQFVVYLSSLSNGCRDFMFLSQPPPAKKLGRSNKEHPHPCNHTVAQLDNAEGQDELHYYSPL